MGSQIVGPWKIVLAAPGIGDTFTFHLSFYGVNLCCAKGENEGGFVMGNLADLADLKPEQLTEAASPALRAAIERHKDGDSSSMAFRSFINPDN
ncbi:hypothetical protein AB0L63_17375 [Nocardia sp. NPDC051990]|uniref:hypothetical protein n=1 Tax=Nocardia sp. NPDC051990 TaxID=3155285 RepID=UPI003431BAC2